MNRVLIIGKNEMQTAFKNQVFVMMTLLFLLLSVLSVYIGSTTKSVEMQTYQTVVTNLQASGSSNLPDAPLISSLSVLQNIVTYIGIVGAVMAIFLGFDGISKEREQGTLRLILVRPIFRDQLVLGKILGAVMVLGSILALTFVGNLILYSLVMGILPSGGDILRLLLVLFFGFLYMMGFYIAALYMSMHSEDKVYSFLLMMILWITVSFVIPQLADSQRTFTYNMNATTQVMTKIATNTGISDFIEIFSPTVHYNNLSFDLLQVNTTAMNLDVLSVLKLRSMEIIYMIIPGLVFLGISFLKFLKEEVSS